MKTKFNPKKQINNCDDYIGYANEVLEIFLSGFNLENNLTRIVDEDDPEEAEFMYTQRGCKLAEKMIRLLCEVGENHYPDEFEASEIYSYLYVEY